MNNNNTFCQSKSGYQTEGYLPYWRQFDVVKPNNSSGYSSGSSGYSGYSSGSSGYSSGFSSNSNSCYSHHIPSFCTPSEIKLRTW